MWNEVVKEFVCGNLELVCEVFYEIMIVEWVVVFDKLVMCEVLVKYFELDGVYKMLYDVYWVGQDVVYLWVEIFKELYSGWLVGDGVMLDEFK